MLRGYGCSGEECFVGKAEHDVLEDDDDTDDSSELDDVLFGSNALLRERIEKAAEMGSETAARWLKRRHRRKQRQKEHRCKVLFWLMIKCI